MNTIIKCIICNKLEENYFLGDISEEMFNKELCFDCAFWTAIIRSDEINPEKAVVVNNRHYIIGEETPRNIFQTLGRGFGGSKFIIQFNSGKRLETTNLWHQGMIPDRFRNNLPDNATFIWNI
jgi:hypothetical protein